MPRPANPASDEKEARLQQAITVFRNKENNAIKIIAEYDIFHRTFFYPLRISK